MIQPEELLARVSLTELAALCGCTTETIRQRIRQGAMSRPKKDGTFDRLQAMAEFGAKKKRPSGRAGGRPRKEDRPAKLPGLEAEMRWRLARARREEMAIRHLEGALIETKVASGMFHERAREIRDRLLAWPGIVAPKMAAELGIDPVKLQQGLETAMRPTLEALAAEQFALPKKNMKVAKDGARAA